MSIDKNHSEQFEKYLKGEMTSEEANAFERKNLNDSFSQEALDGLENQNSHQAFKDIESLKEEISTKSKKPFVWMRIAAVIALLIVGSLTIWFTIDQVVPTETELAMEKESQPELIESIPDSTAPEKGELIAEAEMIEDPEVKKFKKDGVKVVDKIEVDDKEIDHEDIEEMEPINSIALAETDEIVGNLIEVESPVSIVIEERVASTQVEESINVVAEFAKIDSSELEDLFIAASPLIAQENNSTILSKESETTQKSRQSAARNSGASKRSIQADELTISGIVTDNLGNPLPGINVIVKGTTNGTTTDINGRYSLSKIGNMILIYSFIGFESQEVEVGNRTTIDLSLGGSTELQEVVVTAQGINREKRALGYSVSYADKNKKATPNNGFDVFQQYLEDSIVYPEAAKANNIKGTVVLELTISHSGEISNIDIKKSLGYGCDEEAIRLIQHGPKWEPARKEGKQVEDKVKVKVKFKL